MNVNHHLIILLLLPLGTLAADNDFRNRLNDCHELCQAGNHEEAVAAYVELADSQTAIEEKFNALSAAARCARLHLRSEARALELCDRLDEETWRLACRAVIYQWATNPAQVLEDLGEVDITTWPDALAATGFMVRANAHYRQENGQQAVDDYVRAYQFSSGREKWGALQRLGDTFNHLLDDEILAEACYRHAMNNGGFAWSGLQARVSLGNLLIRQGRFDDALAVFSASPDGTWRTSMLLGTARTHLAANNREAARQTLDEIRAWPHASAAQKQETQSLLEALGED